ncbi:hypothetical protein BC832DRAFT_588717 [Gaertneriomyces semiglobifer]|nr:hypothetical protein BC832DRAFT_588717 [Gaertneriomyces semiglobifer]
MTSAYIAALRGKRPPPTASELFQSNIADGSLNVNVRNNAGRVLAGDANLSVVPERSLYEHISEAQKGASKGRAVSQTIESQSFRNVSPSSGTQSPRATSRPSSSRSERPASGRGPKPINPHSISPAIPIDREESNAVVQEFSLNARPGSGNLPYREPRTPRQESLLRNHQPPKRPGSAPPTSMRFSVGTGVDPSTRSVTLRSSSGSRHESKIPAESSKPHSPTRIALSEQIMLPAGADSCKFGKPSSVTRAVPFEFTVRNATALRRPSSAPPRQRAESNERSPGRQPPFQRPQFKSRLSGTALKEEDEQVMLDSLHVRGRQLNRTR